jgi:thiamine-monophosphate kinase
VQIVFDADAIAAGQALEAAAAALGVSACDLALYGGEDYALVVASARPIEGFRPIGEVRAGAGLVLRSGGKERAIEPGGYDHFA